MAPLPVRLLNIIQSLSVLPPQEGNFLDKYNDG